MSMKRHAPDPTDHGVTLCSVSKEGEKGKEMLDPIMAQPGETITCGRCRALICLVKRYIGPRFRLRGGWRSVVRYFM